MHVTLLAKVHNGPKEIKQSFEALEGFKEINEVLGSQLLVVLGGNLDTDLEILTDISLQHSPDALQGVIHRERAKVIDQPGGVEHVGVDHGTLDVIDVGVVFQSSLEESSFLAELGNVGFIIVSEHLVPHDSICNLYIYSIIIHPYNLNS